jgi:cyclin T
MKDKVWKTRQQLDEDTPTRRDGVTKEEELKWRRWHCQLIRDVGIKTKMPPWGIGSACLFCHRFYAVKSMKSNDRLLIATAALLLASKVEESPKSLKSLCEASLQERFKNDPAGYRRFKDNPSSFDDFKEQVLFAERVLLYTLGFELNMSHPYSHILSGTKTHSTVATIGDAAPDDSFKIIPSDNTVLIQTIFDLLNDSYKTTVGLQYDSKTIACAALYLATHCLKLKLPYKGNSFWTHFNIPIADVTAVMDQVLDLYGESHSSAAYIQTCMPFVSKGADGHLHADLRQQPLPPIHRPQLTA